MPGDYSEPRLALGLGDMLRNSEIYFQPLQVFKDFGFAFMFIYVLLKTDYNKI